MAEARRCDICGNLYAINEKGRAKCCGENVHIMRVYNVRGDRIKKFDLCPKCSVAIGNKVQELSGVVTQEDKNGD